MLRAAIVVIMEMNSVARYPADRIAVCSSMLIVRNMIGFWNKRRVLCLKYCAL